MTLENTWSSPISGFDVTYDITGPISSGPVTEPFPGSISGLGTASFSFAATADMSATGIYSVTITATLAGDTDPTNDTHTPCRTRIPPRLTLSRVEKSKKINPNSGSPRNRQQNRK